MRVYGRRNRAWSLGVILVLCWRGARERCCEVRALWGDVESLSHTLGPRVACGVNVRGRVGVWRVGGLLGGAAAQQAGCWLFVAGRGNAARGVGTKCIGVPT